MVDAVDQNVTMNDEKEQRTMDEKVTKDTDWKKESELGKERR